MPNGDSRSPIPADIKRQVLIEAGHMCAIPTCQYPAVEIAHIVPYAEVRQHDADNLIALCPNHHDLYDRQKKIDRKSMEIYKQKLQLLNKRYTKYEMRLLALLAEKPAVVADGEIHTLGLLRDGLIVNAKTITTQTITLSDAVRTVVFQDAFVQSYAAQLTEKGRQFIRNWKSTTEGLAPLF